jgi:hypothetical protein
VAGSALTLRYARRYPIHFLDVGFHLSRVLMMLLFACQPCAVCRA